MLRILNFLDFSHVCNIIISNNEKSILKCKYTQKKKLSDLIPSDCNWTRTHNHSVWPNSWVFVYELSGCGFESSCSHLNFRFRACFEQRVPWHSGNYRVWIHSETRTWHDENIQLDLIPGYEVNPKFSHDPNFSSYVFHRRWKKFSL